MRVPVAIFNGLRVIYSGGVTEELGEILMAQNGIAAVNPE